MSKKVGMLCKMQIETKCDDVQNIETPYLIENCTKTTYQILKLKILLFLEKHMPILKGLLYRFRSRHQAGKQSTHEDLFTEKAESK